MATRAIRSMDKTKPAGLILPSLLKRLEDRLENESPSDREKLKRDFDLGMEDWSDSDFKPLKKKVKASRFGTPTLTPKRKAKASRFGMPTVPPSEKSESEQIWNANSYPREKSESEGSYSQEHCQERSLVLECSC